MGRIVYPKFIDISTLHHVSPYYYSAWRRLLIWTCKTWTPIRNKLGLAYSWPWKPLKEGDELFRVDPNATRCSDCNQIGNLSRSGYTTKTTRVGHTLTFVFICIKCDYPGRVIPNEIAEHSDGILDAEVIG